MVLVSDKVDVFKGRCVRGSALFLTAVGATLEVIDTCDVVLVVEAQGVTHQYQMDFLVILHLDSINTIDSR